MKLTELKRNSLAYIKKIDIPNDKLRIHLMEMGFLKGTFIKIVRYSKNKNIITINLRNYDISLSKDILENIWVDL